MDKETKHIIDLLQKRIEVLEKELRQLRSQISVNQSVKNGMQSAPNWDGVIYTKKPLK